VVAVVLQNQRRRMTILNPMNVVVGVATRRTKVHLVVWLVNTFFFSRRKAGMAPVLLRGVSRSVKGDH
jgi:hypothetical protein